MWTYSLLKELLAEFDMRFDSSKHQRAKNLLKALSEVPTAIPDGSTAMRLAMPDEYRDNSPVTAYRNYYIGDKQHLGKWSKRGAPYWWKEINV